MKPTIASIILSATIVYGVVHAAEPAAATDRMNWFRDAKFGMFIHWGPYAVPAGEWDGKTKDAGMKYLVLTAKHHDGFCMYDTKFTDFSIVKASPYQKDPLKDLAGACRAAGIKFCIYYSIADWHHPESPAEHSQRGFHGNRKAGADVSKYADFMRDQVHELLTNYGDVGLFWFDNGGAYKTAVTPSRWARSTGVAPPNPENSTSTCWNGQPGKFEMTGMKTKPSKAYLLPTRSANLLFSRKTTAS